MKINKKFPSDNKWLTFPSTWLGKLVRHKLSLISQSQTTTGVVQR